MRLNEVGHHENYLSTKFVNRHGSDYDENSEARIDDEDDLQFADQ